MKKIIPIVLVIFALLLPANALAQEGGQNPGGTVSQKRAAAHHEVAKAYHIWQGTKAEIGAQAGIDYLKSVNANANTAALEGQLTRFSNNLENIKTATVGQIPPIAVSQIGVVVAFRTTFVIAVGLVGGTLTAAVEAVNDAYASNQATLDNLEDGYWTTFETEELKLIDGHITNAQTVIDGMTSRGINTAQAQSLLDTIQTDRDALPAAFASRTGANVRTLLQSIRIKFIDLNTEIVRINVGGTVSVAAIEGLKLAEHVRDDTKAVIDLINIFDPNHAQQVLQPIHDRGSASVDLAKTEVDAGNYANAIPHLIDAGGNFGTLIDEIVSYYNSKKASFSAGQQSYVQSVITKTQAATSDLDEL